MVGSGVEGAAYAAPANGSERAATASTAPQRRAARTHGLTPLASTRCAAPIGPPSPVPALPEVSLPAPPDCFNAWRYRLILPWRAGLQTGGIPQG
ncbi:hypothetical protein GCM10010193_21390 [Kitasatospora atroaurantiaca]